MELIVYAVYTFLAIYNAGNMMTLQIQHYGIYPSVGAENFKRYMSANNKAALIPSVLPGMLMLIGSIVLLFFRPVFLTASMAIVSFALNIIGFISTARWQRRIQADMASTGYNDAKIKLLISTNWIRTIVFILLGILTITILARAVQ